VQFFHYLRTCPDLIFSRRDSVIFCDSVLNVVLVTVFFCETCLYFLMVKNVYNVGMGCYCHGQLLFVFHMVTNVDVS
jgi:hypothetical protein